MRFTFERVVRVVSDGIVAKGMRGNLHRIALFLAILMPVLIVMFFNYVSMRRGLTESVYAQKKATAYLAAAILTERLDELCQIGISIAQRPRLVEYVSSGNWDEAIHLQDKIPRAFPFIDALFITDPAGVLKQGIQGFQDIIGSDRSFRDYYKGVMASSLPYVSEVYQRANAPRMNVVAVAVPIRDVNETRIIGIIVMQIKLETFAKWAQEVDSGPGSSMYILDQKKQLVYHSAIDAAQSIVDFSNESGESGRLLSVHAPVGRFRWEIVIAQPLRYAFILRDRNLLSMLAIYVFVIIASLWVPFLIMQTINDRRQMELALENLERSNKELSAFSYSISHDLRAPLRAMAGFSKIINLDFGAALDAGVKDYLNRISAAAESMSGLIDDLLSLARVSEAKLGEDSFDLSALVKQVLQELAKAQPERSVSCNVDDGIMVTADIRLCKIALENLLGNAWKFTSKTNSALIEFGVAEQDGARAYFVRDNGAGFDMAYAVKLFMPFQRMHTKTEFAGNGIGLAIVQRIILRHGGRIWADARPGAGAAFYFTLSKN
jgi:signal transduction histidine kinase